MSEVDDSIIHTLEKVANNWGQSDFRIELYEDWKEVVKRWKRDGGKVIHLTMYGINVDDIIKTIRVETKLLVVIGARKVPRELYDIADMNIAVGNQPHSEIAALAIFLDRVFNGNELRKQFNRASYRIIPATRGKNVEHRSVDN